MRIKGFHEMNKEVIRIKYVTMGSEQIKMRILEYLSIYIYNKQGMAIWACWMTKTTLKSMRWFTILSITSANRGG